MAGKTVAIIGGGPAGGALGNLLCQRGYQVGIFHTDKRPPLIVGESLLPATVPLMRKLGIEDEVKAFSMHKPGATVCLKMDEVITAMFRWADGSLPDYAYNTPRDLFDRCVLNSAEKAGAKIFYLSAKLEKGEAANSVKLSEETLEGTEKYFGGQPDWIVDASGRARVIPRLLELSAAKGGRNDVALFAHLDTVKLNDPGNIHVDNLSRGWGWRIPLPGRTSLGVVINPKHLEKYGSGIEAQYDAYIHEEPALKLRTENSKRLTPVVKYQNYQLISDRMYGANWSLVGDSAGFIDPVFSTGVYLGMKSAFEMCKAMEVGTEEALQRYQERKLWEFHKWQNVIDSWYSGVLFNLYRAGQRHKGNIVGNRLSKRVEKRLLRIFNGQAVDDVFNMKIFEYLIAFGKVLRDHRDLQIA